MQTKKPPILWQRGAIWLALLGPFFFLSYGWVNYYTSGRSDVGVIVEAWEHRLPFVPWLMLPYMSIDAFYAISLFTFRKRNGLDRHALRLLLATVISLIGFLLFPLQFSFAVPRVEGFNGVLQSLLLGFDKPYNQAPSLHISLLIILWVVYASKLQNFWRWLLHLWFFAIAASVLLVYQHHFIDVWTGALVGVFCLYIIPNQPFSWRRNPPTNRMMNIAIRYFLAATLMLIAGFLAKSSHGILSALLFWSSIACYLIAAAYLGFSRQVFQRHNGNMRWPAKLLLAPYLLASWLSYRFYTQHNFLPNKIYDHVWLGAFPRFTERQIKNDWFAALDLTNEFPYQSMNLTHTKYLPVMDLISPEPKMLVRAVRWLDLSQQQGNVIVHCALGLSRSASVVACWLVWRGHFDSVQKAIEHINSLRSGIVLTPEHQTNINLALQQLKRRC